MKSYFLVFFLVTITLNGFAQKKPNIIFILVDDQGYGDLGVFYQNQRMQSGDRSKPYQRSPNLDKMASEGAMLTHHYSSAPVCAPSRASIMLGVSQGHADLRDNQFDKALEDNYTMPSTLRQLGYSTVAIGKWGLMGDNRWDVDGSEWKAIPQNRGFDSFFGYMRHSDGHEHYPKEGLYRGVKQVWDNGKNITPDLDKCYTADLWTAYTKKWIIDHKKSKDAEKPFFIYLAYETPHAVLELPTQKYPNGGGINGGVQWTGKPGQMINTASGKIDSYTHSDYVNATYDDDNNPATPEVPWPDTYKRYATANRRIDDAVGDLKQLLKDLKIDSNTIIVYTSDNGPSKESYLPEEYVPNTPNFFGGYGPFEGIKRDNWEGGIRVPTIVSWPERIKPGMTITTPNISYDWAPTFIEAAGGAVPERMDGTSLIPTLTQTGKQEPSNIYIEYYANGNTPDYKAFDPARRGRLKREMQTIRIGDYVGVRYDIKSADDDFEIYNVVNDPGERNNLLNNRSGKDSKSKAVNKKEMEQLNNFMKERVLQLRRPNISTPRPYDKAYVSAIDAKVSPGINWKGYAGDFLWIPQVDELKASGSGHAETPDVEGFDQFHRGVLCFTGYILVPEDGNYTFYLTSNAKAFLRLHEAQLIDADFGYYPGSERKASILLKKGLHPFKLYYKKQDGVKPYLDLEWSGPVGIKQPIPANLFFMESKKQKGK